MSLHDTEKPEPIDPATLSPEVIAALWRRHPDAGSIEEAIRRQHNESRRRERQSHARGTRLYGGAK